MVNESKDLAFLSYLAKKKISTESFREELPQIWEKLRYEFEKAGEASFDARNKFLINNLRLEFTVSDLSDV